MATQYLIVCLFDFILFPILLGIYSVYTHSSYQPWIPLTLQGGGLYHLAMGAIVGVTSWAKTAERIQPSRVYPKHDYPDTDYNEINNQRTNHDR
jgi:hypothetical protein